MNIPADLMELRLLRIWDIVGDPEASPPIPPMVPVSKAAWLNGVKSGLFPKPVKLGPRISAWRLRDIKELMNNPDAFVNPPKKSK